MNMDDLGDYFKRTILRSIPDAVIPTRFDGPQRERGSDSEPIGLENNKYACWLNASIQMLSATKRGRAGDQNQL